MSRNDMYYQALTAHDPRFDGVFFVGVTSTRIYCRPVCPARTPKRANCRFFADAASATKAGFRACLRCRPELTPGSAPVDDAKRIASEIVQRLESGAIEETASLETIADHFQLSSRQIRRIVNAELGVSPIQLLQNRRLKRARHLLAHTHLTITEIAYASGFASLRRFNDAFRKHFGTTPSHLRKNA